MIELNTPMFGEKKKYRYINTIATHAGSVGVGVTFTSCGKTYHDGDEPYFFSNHFFVEADVIPASSSVAINARLREDPGFRGFVDGLCREALMDAITFVMKSNSLTRNGPQQMSDHMAFFNASFDPSWFDAENQEVDA